MKTKIVIVEDDSSLANALKISLEAENFQVFLAANGEEGLAVIEKEMPELILCDINMPKMDGFTMLRHLRASSWGKNLNVIILTNFNDEIVVSKALSYGVFHYLVKSDSDLKQIVKKIKENLKTV
jgi:two-component system, OmpR family, response regulator TrcR